MVTAIIQRYGFEFKIPLKPSALAEAQLKELTESCIMTLAASGHIISASAFELNRGDGLFDYELSADFFENTVSVSLTSEEISLTLNSTGGREAFASLALIANFFQEKLSDRVKQVILAYWQGHASFVSAETSEELFSSNTRDFSSEGFIGFRETMVGEVNRITKIQFEKSFGLQNGLFFATINGGLPIDSWANIDEVLDLSLGLILNAKLDLRFGS